MSETERPVPQAVPAEASSKGEAVEEKKASTSSDDAPTPAGADEAVHKGEKWDASHDIATGSVSTNAAKLFGAGGALSGSAAKSSEDAESKKKKKKKKDKKDKPSDDNGDATESKKKKKKKKKDKDGKKDDSDDNEDEDAKAKTEEATAEAAKDKAGKIEALKSSSELLLGRFDVSGSGGQPMRCTDNEILIRAEDLANDQPVVLQLLSNPNHLESELRARSSTDEDDANNTKTSHIVEVLDVLCDKSETIAPPPGSPFQVTYKDGLAEEIRTHLRTHGDSSQYDATNDEYAGDEHVTDDLANYPCLLVLDDYEQTLESHTDRFPRPNLRLARGVAADVVVGLMLLHTEGKVHRDLSPRRIVRCEDSRENDDYKTEDGQPTGMWKIAGLGSSGSDGDEVENPGALSSNWGYLPPEAAAAIVGGETVTTDSAWDLWSLGCVLYRLVFGSDLWTTSRGGRLSDEDVQKLSNWTKVDIWKRAAVAFPREGRTDGTRAAIDLVAKLLAPTPEERMKNFEFGIISVHQHEFVEGMALEPATLEAFRATQELVAVEEADRARYNAFTEKLSLEESWELGRARNVLLLGAFEPIEVHVPTSFVILKSPISGAVNSEVALREGMRWAKVFSDVGPLVRKALLKNDVQSVGRFWAHIQGLFRGRYVYMYLVDDMTGEPVVLPPGEDTIGHGVPYPIPIKTRSDVLPKLLPLMHLTMRSAALYHGVTGIARLYGGGSDPLLSADVRRGAQAVVDDLKDEHGNAANRPFGSFLADVARARENRERFLKDDDNVRCRALRELVKFYERKGVVVAGKPRCADDFVGLERLADDEGLALWTLLADGDGFQAAIKKRAEERLKEEQTLWSDPFEGRITELEGALEKTEAELEAVATTMSELEEKTAPAPVNVAPVYVKPQKDDEESAKRIRSLEEALAKSKKDQERLAEVEGGRITELESTLKSTMADLEQSKQMTKNLEAQSKQQINDLEAQLASTAKDSIIPAPKEGSDNSVAQSTDASVPAYGSAPAAAAASFKPKLPKKNLFHKKK